MQTISNGNEKHFELPRRIRCERAGPLEYMLLQPLLRAEGHRIGRWRDVDTSKQKW